MVYDLFFRKLKVGVVTYVDSDFPRMFGAISFERSVVKPASDDAIRLARFIELCREQTRLIDVMDKQDVTKELDENNATMTENYLDLMETNDWMLIDENGKILPILCPIFSDDGKIVWYWNVEYSKVTDPDFWAVN